MALRTINDETLSAIANAIRARNGETTTYTPEEMASAITNIPYSNYTNFGYTIYRNTSAYSVHTMSLPDVVTSSNQIYAVISYTINTSSGLGSFLKGIFNFPFGLQYAINTSGSLNNITLNDGTVLVKGGNSNKEVVYTMTVTNNTLSIDDATDTDANWFEAGRYHLVLYGY